MKKRLKKKLYDRYLPDVNMDVAFSDKFMLRMQKTEPFEAVMIDPSEEGVLSEWSAVPCKLYGLQYLAYKVAFNEDEPYAPQFIVVVLSAEWDNIFTTSYNNASSVLENTISNL